MGKELTKLKRRREARKGFEELDDKRDMNFVVHYSCESFYDIIDGRTPRITSIAARNFSTGQTHSFSIHKSAEQNRVQVQDINNKYDELEKQMLDEYFDFIKSRHGYKFMHWNMRDINYGFQAIEHRYKVLGGEPFVIDDSRKFDMARALIAFYGVTYVPHGDSGRLHSLMDMNKITAKDMLTGKEEASAFENKEFIKLHQSTLRKVDVMGNILERILDGSLKTNASWLDTHGVHPAIIVEVVREHWVWSLLLLGAGIIGLIASLKELF
ncbi:hypothetical protein SAMN05660420_03367 [Desulfuromusa kysingii]|uniref:Uncharacterized protein n=1 Tax=Desulfuromusa kysingii TaxID=37625 RepID=A0A1H4EFV5_9BACT|nr:hypothetical protein [Desulfuromusa kysingii]SEA83893.1 hypothetical protein SAMN05660420_03367 [Desulfuromusa kysingii]